MAIKTDPLAAMNPFDMLGIEDDSPKLTPEEVEIQRKLEEQRNALPEAFKRRFATPLFIPEPNVKPMPLKQKHVQIEESPSSAQRKLEAADVQIEESESAVQRKLKVAQEEFSRICCDQSTPSPTS